MEMVGEEVEMDDSKMRELLWTMAPHTNGDTPACIWPPTICGGGSRLKTDI